MTSENIKKLTESSFASDTSTGTILVDFYADWCGPCKMMNPVLENLAKELHGQVTIAKLDIDDAQKIAGEYQVTSIPTLILFKGGKEHGRLVGLRDKQAIKEFVST